jgi:branched-chain amino acid transport system substrate-binding protein
MPQTGFLFPFKLMKRLLVPLFALGILLSACSPVDSDSGPIKLGYIGPLTGEAASYGKDTLNGALLAINEINEAGGVNGRMIELIAEDGRCTGTDAASAAQKLVNVDKVIAIIGGQCSGETLAAAPIAESAQVVMISPISSSPDVTAAGDFIFRDYPSDALKTKAMAGYFEKEGIKKIAAITENTDFAVAFRDALKENIGDALVFDEMVEPGTKDFRSLMARLKDEDFDAFFPNGQTPAAMAAMMQQLREQGLTQLAISHDVAQDSSMFEIAPDAVEGLLAIGVPDVDRDSEFGVKFLAEYGEAQGALFFAAQSYDAARLFADAMTDVGTEGTAIRDYLYGVTDFDGVVGKFGFDDNGDVTGMSYVLWEASNGAFTQGEAVPVN